MKRQEITIGENFGYWKVINEAPSNNGHRRVIVECKCGKIQEIDFTALTNKRSTGCRNCKAQDRSVPIKIGEIYKNWKVIEGPVISKHQNIQWKVLCTLCNKNTRWIQGNELTNKKRCFGCQKCRSQETISKITKQNGRIGKLTKTRYTRLKKNASVRKRGFYITIEELWDLFIKQKQICAVTGDYIENIEDASLDRKDSNKTYTIENVQWTTKQANISKHIMSPKEFIIFCQKVINHANQQPS